MRNLQNQSSSVAISLPTEPLPISCPTSISSPTINSSSHFEFGRNGGPGNPNLAKGSCPTFISVATPAAAQELKVSSLVNPSPQRHHPATLVTLPQTPVPQSELSSSIGPTQVKVISAVVPATSSTQLPFPTPPPSSNESSYSYFADAETAGSSVSISSERSSSCSRSSSRSLLCNKPDMTPGSGLGLLAQTLTSDRKRKHGPDESADEEDFDSLLISPDTDSSLDGSSSLGGGLLLDQSDDPCLNEGQASRMVASGGMGGISNLLLFSSLQPPAMTAASMSWAPSPAATMAATATVPKPSPLDLMYQFPDTCDLDSVQKWLDICDPIIGS